MNNILKTIGRSLSFALWSLRRRIGQMVPVAIAFLLLMSATQLIGTLHDISSILTSQQVTHSWRDSYDLLVRPQSSISQPERSAGWIDPQFVLEDYGGINAQQLNSIHSITHVKQVIPFANVGWQPIDMLLPVELPAKGVYRISAAWTGMQNIENPVVRYVNVTDFAHLLSEVPVTEPMMDYLVMKNGANSVTFSFPVQTLQDVIGIPIAQQTTIRRLLVANTFSVSNMHVTLTVDRLRGALSTLPGCLQHADCWQALSVHSGTVHYEAHGVQLLRYSPVQYRETSQEMANGQLSLEPLGQDMQGSFYREQLPASVSVSTALTFSKSESQNSLLPLAGPIRMPQLPTALRFIPIEQACAMNGVNCYSGFYVQVNGAEHYSPTSLALLQATAAAIEAHTGLHVDILDGSSLRTISLNIGGSNAPHSTATSWRAVGVAVQIVHGVDALQETLLVLCSIICLLAIGAAGVLVGFRRRKEALVLQQIGWSPYLISLTFLEDALLLCFPGCILSITGMVLIHLFGQESFSEEILWLLLVSGTIVYLSALVLTASVSLYSHSGTNQKRIRFSFHRFALAGRLPLFICGIDLTLSIFLIAMGYLLMTSFNSVLIVTVLGRQVHAALEGPQLALMGVVLSAALLTVGLCTKLLLQGRRNEVSLLAMVGWEAKAVFLRVMWESWRVALISGEIGMALAVGVLALVATIPSPAIIALLVVAGPLVGMVVASLATTGFAWQETKRAFL